LQVDPAPAVDTAARSSAVAARAIEPHTGEPPTTPLAITCSIRTSSSPPPPSTSGVLAVGDDAARDVAEAGGEIHIRE
jgi:hypothetical protein